MRAPTPYDGGLSVFVVEERGAGGEKLADLLDLLGGDALEADAKAGHRVARLRIFADPTHGAGGFDRLGHVRELERHVDLRAERPQLVGGDEQAALREVLGEAHV